MIGLTGKQLMQSKKNGIAKILAKSPMLFKVHVTQHFAGGTKAP